MIIMYRLSMRSFQLDQINSVHASIIYDQLQYDTHVLYIMMYIQLSIE